MKSFDLNACGVMEMNTCEMVNVEGGNVFKAVVNVVVGAACAVAEAAVWLYDNVLSKPCSTSID